MTKKISADEMISRIYNMTRGIVSPDFAKTEMKMKTPKPRGGVTNRKMGGKIPAKKKK